MSDTTSDDDAVELDPIPNFLVKRKAAKHNGVDEEWLEVRYGSDPLSPELPQHVVEVRRVDMGDQFDLAEIAGPAVENGVWLSLAIVAMSVQTIDGTPQPRGTINKAVLRRTLVALGPTGVRAIRRASNTFDAGAAVDDAEAAERSKAAAGN